MRVRRAVWRSAGPGLGRAAPRLLHAYYDVVVGSLVRSCENVGNVSAVYAHGSYAARTLRPGRSDVDLVAVVEDVEAQEEVALLRELRRRYVLRQAALPIDLTVVSRSEYARDAGWIAARRRDLLTGAPLVPLGAWRLLAGTELREPTPWMPDPRLLYATERVVSETLAAPRRPLRRTPPLARLADAVARARLDTPEARKLLDPRSPPHDALAAALELIDVERARHAFPLERVPDTRGWKLPAPDRKPARSLLAGLDLRSATIYRDPLTLDHVLLLEVARGSAAPVLGWALDQGTAATGAAGLRLEVTTTRLAEDSWRAGFRWVGLAGASSHLGGEPLVERVRLPVPDVLRDLLDFRAFTACEIARATVLGLRTMRRDEVVLPQLELALALLGRMPVKCPRPGRELDDAAWAQRAVELRRACSALVRQDDAVGPHPVPVD